MKITKFFIFICCPCLFFFCYFDSVKAASCPTGKKYAIIQYDHTLRNVSTSPGSTFGQISTLFGGVGIQVSKRGVANAGNDEINKKIWQVISTPNCYCQSIDSPAESWVTVKISGTCTNGKLKMHIHEKNPVSYAWVSCSGSSCSTTIYMQPYLPATSDYDLTMSFVNNSTVTQPYTCPNCSGNYSWQIKFTNKPPPMMDTPPSLAPLITPLLLNH